MSRYAMLAAVLLLPVALAALCTCPSSSPEDSPVCGSDGRTYYSECALQCAGLSAAYPGPCNTTEVHAGRRSTVEYKDWVKCINERPQCRPVKWSCSKECGDDRNCGLICFWNCICGCGGLPTGVGAEPESHYRWYECYEESSCSSTKYECTKNCHNQACRDSCMEDYLRCMCRCVEVAATGSTASPATSTGPAPTASSTDHSVRALWYVLMFVTACVCTCVCAGVCACVLVICRNMNTVHRPQRGPTSPGEGQQGPGAEMTSK